MIGRWRRFAAITIACAAAAFATPVRAASAPALLSPALLAQVEVPKNDGWVTDQAGLLTPDQERSLEILMESYKQGTKHEIALLTVPSLNGESIERFTLEVGRAWGIGSAERNNAALLVVSKADRELRIEVARGLEGNLTDSISGRIIRDVIVPRFKQGDFAGGLRAGVEAMHAAIGGDYGKLPRERKADRGLGGLVPLFFNIGVVLFVVMMRRARHGSGRRRNPLGFGPFIPMSHIGGFGGLGGGRSSGGGGRSTFSGFGGGGGFSGGGASGRW